MNTQTTQTKDEAARANPLLRVQMMALLREVQEMLTDHAFELAQAERGRYPKPKEEDEAKDRLVWQLAEFLSQGEWPRDSENPVLKGFQINDHYASDWFQTGLAITEGERDRWVANDQTPEEE